ncbi:hypothetical protein [Mucilaginibacter aquaedulcis]|uniref:hypothetical protein n=1 Tax=Mucilaginibacter aquaedulcis TaxID=1187081 RepID=UPI0025B2A594|nr:hypothetical protein [Mucilaginibacter aquaedulcis]MDN3548923.1 hypothetical protein [Mucilaginibacter aquaedulcis]
MKLQSTYFCVAVIFMGSIGIWLPIGIEALIDKKVTFHNVPPNITTYFMSILFAGCIDYFLSKLRDLNVSGIATVFMNLIVLILVSFLLVIGAVIFSVFKQDLWSFALGVVGVIIAYRVWWIANINNPNFFPNPIGAVGGDLNKPLQNG